MGGYGIVGGNLPLAAGSALASDYKGEDAVCLCMFGDGASNPGNFGETMNLAALWKLPVVFLVENNQYGMGTALQRHSAVTDLSQEGRVLRRSRRARRRHGRARRARGDRRAHPDRARGAPADAGRGAHLPVPRPLRPTPRSTARRRRSRSGASRTRSSSSPALLERTACSTRASSTQIRSDRGARDRGGRVRRRVPEPALESLYDNLYVLGDQAQGWYAVDERTPEAHPGEDGARDGRRGRDPQARPRRAPRTRGRRRRGRTPPSAKQRDRGAGARETEEAAGWP